MDGNHLCGRLHLPARYEHLLYRHSYTFPRVVGLPCFVTAVLVVGREVFRQVPEVRRRECRRRAVRAEVRVQEENAFQRDLQ